MSNLKIDNSVKHQCMSGSHMSKMHHHKWGSHFLKVMHIFQENAEALVAPCMCSCVGKVTCTANAAGSVFKCQTFDLLILTRGDIWTCQSSKRHVHP